MGQRAADVKVVQQMLGHKSATMTLDLYSHLFDEVANALDPAARTTLVPPPVSVIALASRADEYRPS
jgi:hypothetical protein